MEETRQEDTSGALEDIVQLATERSPRVLIVGAGFAGVAAAGTLLAGGIHDVTILEALDRPGGRVQTILLEDGHLEMGAQFLHGEEGNPLFALADKEGLLLDGDTDEETGPDTIIQYKHDLFYTPDGHVVPKDVITDLLSRLEDLTMEANRVYDKGEANDITVSMGDYFRQRYPTLFDGLPANEDLKKSMIRWFEAWHILDSGGTVDQLSLPGHGKYHYNPGSGIQETKTGMAALLHVLLRDTVPSACLRLKKPVRTVYWNASSVKALGSAAYDRTMGHLNGLLTPTLNNNVMLDLRTLVDARMGEFDPMLDSGTDLKVLRTSGKGSVDDDDDTTAQVVRRNQQNVSAQNGGMIKQSGCDVMVECEDGEIFEADHVIVTSSIGFLQGHPGFFQPSLPAKHWKAVQAMGFGTIAKVFLMWETGKGDNPLQSCVPCVNCDTVDEWRHQVLGRDVDNIQLLWPEGFKPQLPSAKNYKRTSTGKPWYADVSSFGLIHSQEMCLLTWICGEAAEIMETVPESEVIDVLYELLALYLKKPAMPRPSRMVRTTWHTNPYTRGSYSYLATGGSLELHDLLREPLPSPQMPVLQLAGEACSKHHFSTAHGALQSGRMAALALLRHYKMATE